MDFSALVLAPGMNAFARVCTFYPRVSQPDIGITMISAIR